MKRYKVTSVALNVRAGPGKHHPVLRVLQQNDLITAYVIPSGWVALELEDGDLGWVSAKYLELVPEEPSPEDWGPKLLELAAQKLGQEYVYGASADFTDPHYNGPWDCAEFVSWVFYMVTGRVVGCENNEAPLPDLNPWTGWWKRDADLGLVKHVGVERAVATPGAILLRYPRRRHIAFSDGQGGTIEAMGREYGVVRGRAAGRDFNYGILW